jgi:hypothetical protein
MALRKKLELKYKGAEYSLLVTFDVIERIDEQVNIGNLFRDEQNDSVKITKKARFVAVVLREAGAKVTDDEIYEVLTTGGAVEVNELYLMMLWAMLADNTPKKKEEAAA